MVLSDGEIIGLLEEGSLCIEPLEQEQIQPASVDIRLGNTFCVLEDTPGGIIRLSDDVKYKMITTDKYLLLPGQFVLATTVEYFKMPDNLTAFVEGRSSLGRLAVHPERRLGGSRLSGGDHAGAVQCQPVRHRAGVGA